MSPPQLLTPINVLLWMLIVGIIGFAAMGVDKLVAGSDWGDRMSEKTLWLTALAGGFAGIIVGAKLFHQDT